jgi:hypothetical protein
VNRYFISGHSLEHLCFAMVTLILTGMLSFRNIKIVRYPHKQFCPFEECCQQMIILRSFHTLTSNQFGLLTLNVNIPLKSWLVHYSIQACLQ